MIATAQPTTASAIEQLLTKRQAAVLLQVCVKTLENYIRRGQIPAVKLGASVRIDPLDLRRFIDAQKVTTAREPAAV